MKTNSKRNKKTTKSRTITSNKEKRNKNINLISNRKNYNSKIEYPSLKVGNKSSPKQNYINRILNIINMLEYLILLICWIKIGNVFQFLIKTQKKKIYFIKLIVNIALANLQRNQKGKN